MGEEVRARLSGHGFSTEASLLICGSKAAGVPRGMALLVAGRSPRRGGRERSERWKGESGAFSLQRDAGGNERADESHTRAWALKFRSNRIQYVSDDHQEAGTPGLQVLSRKNQGRL